MRTGRKILMIGAIAATIAVSGCGQPSYEGLGGDPNPTEQYADPCSFGEGACDAGNVDSYDVVPDRNGELPDQ